MSGRKTTDKLEDYEANLPAKYRKTIWAILHYVFWTLALLLLWPVSIIFKGLEKLLYHEKKD